MQMRQQNGGLYQTAEPIGQELYPNVDDRFSNQHKLTPKCCSQAQMGATTLG